MRLSLPLSLPLPPKNKKKIKKLKKKKKTIPFTRSYKRIKCVRINLEKEVQDLYTERHYKTSLKEIKKTYINRRTFHISGLEDSIIETSIVLRLI